MWVYYKWSKTEIDCVVIACESCDYEYKYDYGYDVPESKNDMNMMRIAEVLPCP